MPAPTVTVLLPSTGPEAGTGQEAGAEPAQAPGRGMGETVLVVEDEPAMREVTCRILSRGGYRVLTAASGREAIEIATSTGGDIDVLLTDVVMPQMLGKEAADRIRAFRCGVKVLFTSGYTVHRGIPAAPAAAAHRQRRPGPRFCLGNHVRSRI